MQAAVLHEFGKPLRMENRPLPPLGPDDVLVRVLASGVCHSDLHIIDGLVPEITLPRVLGHEIAGEAAELGPVLVYGAWGCGSCKHCLKGDEQLCKLDRLAGWEQDGGYADYVVVPSRRYLMPLQGLDPIRAAPLADAGITAYRAVCRVRAWLKDGGCAVVIGVGGLGQFAVQFLRLMTKARVLAVDINEAKLARAITLGAQAAFLPDQAPKGTDVILDFVGTSDSLALSTRLVDRGGIVVQIGEGSGTIPFGLGLTDFEVTLTTSILGSLPDVRAVLDYARKGCLQWDVQEFPLSDANAALAKLRQGELLGRAVLRP